MRIWLNIPFEICSRKGIQRKGENEMQNNSCNKINKKNCNEGKWRRTNHFSGPYISFDQQPGSTVALFTIFIFCTHDRQLLAAIFHSLPAGGIIDACLKLCTEGYRWPHRERSMQKKFDFVRIQNPIAWRHLVPSPIDSLQFGPANLFGCLLIVQKLVTALRRDSQWSFIAHANFHLNYLNSISEYKFGVFRYGE